MAIPDDHWENEPDWSKTYSTEEQYFEYVKRKGDSPEVAFKTDTAKRERYIAWLKGSKTF